MNLFKTLLLVVAATSACGGSTEQTQGSAGSVAASTESRLLSIPVVHRSGDPAEALVGGVWRSLQGETLPVGAKELRAQGRGSVVTIGGANVWLRSGARMGLSQRADGTLQFDMREGQARVVSADGTRLMRADRSVALPANDVLLSRAGARTAMIATRQRPGAASWSLELDEAAEQRGVGTLEVKESSQSALELRRLAVMVKVEGGMAITEVEHVFYNADDQQREGTFRFPAPDGVMVTGMAMEIDGRLMEGEFVESIKARQVYEKIVDEMQDPALLEWQQGGWFKLRVFPIEAQSEKRVVLRYAAPLQPAIEGYEYRYLATPPDQSVVGKFSMRLDGKVVSEQRDLGSTTDVVLAFPESAVPDSVGEQRGDYGYRALTIRPEMPATTAGPNASRELVIAVDSSRSALENRTLSLELLELVLAELGPGDKFAVFAHDIRARPLAPGLVPATEENIEGALRFAKELEFDGASDLGATLEHAGHLAKSGDHAQIVYLGDGTPSWGKTGHEDLAEVAHELGDTPLYAALLGRGASTELWTQLCGRQGGKILRPHTRAEARRDAFFLARAQSVPRIEKVSIAGSEDLSIFPKTPRTVFAGDAMTILVRALNGNMPANLTMSGVSGGTLFEQKVSLAASRETSGLVSQRWGSHEIARLEHEDGSKEDIVALSKEFGVLSKHTSLLVLESEEAYKQHQIERRNAKAEKLVAQNSPTVSGQDLDNLGAREASLSPDHIQPGDPEVRIPAPADARSVVLVFPFGDTKLAHYDAESQTWIARFLIDTETPDGRYWVRVTVEHANGELEEMRLPYTVDTSPPSVSLKVVKLRGNRFRVFVNQEGEGEEAASAQALDASRVEVLLPWGQTHRLFRKELGSFAKTLRAPQPLGETISLRLVVTDEALNQRVLEVVVPVEQR